MSLNCEHAVDIADQQRLLAQNLMRAADPTLEPVLTTQALADTCFALGSALESNDDEVECPVIALEEYPSSYFTIDGGHAQATCPGCGNVRQAVLEGSSEEDADWVWND